MENTNFLEQLILKADPEIDDAGLEIMVADAEPILQEWIFTNIVSKLTADQRQKLIQITEKDNYITWKAYEYLSSVIENYEDFIWKVYDDFEKMYLKNFKEFSK